jgi:DNA-binding winged helix-turn-helix (wHTH) protein
MPPPAVKFGEFELDSAAFELRRKGRPVRVERLPLEFLLLLVSRKGELVTRDEIVGKLWGNDVFIDTNTVINVAVCKAGKALRDDADSPRFLLTVPSKGYRFVATVKEKPTESSISGTLEAEPAIQGETPPSSFLTGGSKSWLRPWMAWGALGVAAAPWPF